MGQQEAKSIVTSKVEDDFDMDDIPVDEKYGIIQSPYYLIKILVIDTSGSMDKADCILDNEEMSRLEVIQRRQLQTLRNDKLFLAWFIYTFDDQLNTLFKTDLSVPREVWTKKAATQIKNLEAKGDTDIEVAMKSLNNEFKEILDYLNSQQEQNETLQRPMKFWIFFLTDNEDNYDSAKLEKNSIERDELFKKYNVKRFIKIWDQKVKNKEKLKKALALNPEIDEQYVNAEDEVKNTYKIMKLNSQQIQFEKQIENSKKESQQAQEKVNITIQQNNEVIEQIQNKNEEELQEIVIQIEIMENQTTQSLITSQLNTETVQQKYEQFKSNCECVIENKKELEAQNETAYTLVDKNQENEKDIERQQAIKLFLKRKVRFALQEIKEWKEQDQKVVEENISDLNNQLEFLNEQYEKDEMVNVQKKADIHQNSKLIIMETLKNFLTMFEKLIQYSVKFDEKINKFNQKVARSKLLNETQIKMQTEAASVYDKEFQESQNLLNKLITSLSKNLFCFQELQVDDSAKLKSFYEGYQQLKNKFEINQKYQGIVDQIQQLLQLFEKILSSDFEQKIQTE